MPEEINYSRRAIECLGVDPDNLGCVMLDIESRHIDEYRSKLALNMAYYSRKLSYVKGYSGTPHVTLLYGLMLSAKENRDLVDGVLDGWVPPAVLTFYDFDVFPGNDGDAEYGCIVLKPGLNHWDLAPLEDANARLSKLPHVRGFYRYNPHVTIGYVKKSYISEALSILRGELIVPLVTGDLNYGD